MSGVETCQGGDTSKEQITILFCFNLVEEFEIPLVNGMWPICLKGINLDLFHVEQKSVDDSYENTVLVEDCYP